VERIVDGDTIIVEAAGHGVTLRLIGMDTPEVVDPRKQPQCFGPEASEKAKEILSGLKIEVEKDPLKGDYDKYGRVLGYVHVEPGESSDFPDGLFYNQFMIENGYAREYTYFKEPYAYQAAFKDAEITAKKEKRGLWGMCAKNVREKSG
jgi:micrococcal nuclease